LGSNWRKASTRRRHPRRIQHEFPKTIPAGFGAEYALGGNWSVKAEYLRVMLGDTTVNVPFDPANSAIGETGSIKVNQDMDLIRAGINYKFGGQVAARY